MGEYYKRSDIKENSYYGPPKFIWTTFGEKIQYKEMVVADGDRLDIICHRIYGSPKYWKAIALFNGIDYFFDMTPGTILKLPVKIDEIMNKI